LRRSHASGYAEKWQVHQPSGGEYGIAAGRARTSCCKVARNAGGHQRPVALVVDDGDYEHPPIVSDTSA
jgi:hypothetical protein